MNALDIIIIALILIGFVLGYKDGFIRKLIGLIGFALAIFLAIRYSDFFGSLIEQFFGMDIYMAEIVGGVFVFTVTIIVSAILKRLIHPFDKVNNFTNQLIGGIVGGIQILYFTSALLLILHIFNVPNNQASKSSFLYSKVYNILPVTIDYLSNYAQQPKDIIKDYINRKDSI